jgi:hypothetical protein
MRELQEQLRAERGARDARDARAQGQARNVRVGACAALICCVQTGLPEIQGCASSMGLGPFQCALRETAGHVETR